MPLVNVNIQPEVLSWALKQTNEEKINTKLKKNITQWLSGTKIPTFNQIEEFSKISNIPLGYFFLQTPPIEQIELLDYRTVDSIQLTNPSRNLIDTIYEMEKIQDWMKDYRQEFGFDILSVVGSMDGISDVFSIVDRIRTDLELETNWYEQFSDARESFNYLRGKLEKWGIIVMMSGYVGKNTHRTLNINEFRAFAMVDEWAPLIFINSSDSNGARLFSLIHEVVHIWIGKNDFFNDRRNIENSVKVTEELCNAVAAEIIVPTDAFLNKWKIYKSSNEVSGVISELARCFRCSEVVIARKAMDFNSLREYEQIVQKAIDNYNLKREKKDKQNGNYYNTICSQIDRCFIRALCESISMGKTSYTEAYRLTNTSCKTFHEVVQRIGGVKW